MAVRLAINPITWVNDDMPSLGGGTTLETILSETREAGFAGTEMSFQFPKTAAELGPLLKQHHLVLTSGWYDGRILERDIDAEWAAILPHMTLLRDLACSHAPPSADTSRRAEGDLFAPISRRPKLADSEWSGYGRRLTALADRMADFGVRMAFHHHMGTIVETDAEVDRLMAETGPAVWPALRHRPLGVSWAAIRSRCSDAMSAASSTSTARMPARTCSIRPGPRMKVSCRQSSTVSSPCPATASSTTRRS